MALILLNFNIKIKFNKLFKMKNIFLIVPVLLLMSFVNWQSSFIRAVQKAKKENKLILLNFSESDGNESSILFKKEILDNDKFKLFSDTTLMLVNADFPKENKNQLAEEKKTENNELAEIYNSSRIFPKTLLLTADGKIIKTWEGKTTTKADEFIQEIITIIDSRK